MPQPPTNSSAAHGEPRLKLPRGSDGKLIVRCFVSYAHDDKVLKEDLLTRIKREFRSYDHYAFDVWDDKEILVGEGWARAIQRQLAEAHVGICLLSASFLGSVYITKEELPAFVDGQGPARGKRIVPLLLDDIDFKRANLKGLHAVQIFEHDNPFAGVEGDRERNKWAQRAAGCVYDLLEKYADALEREPVPPGPRPQPEIDIASRLNQASALLRSDSGTAVAYLIHAEWAVTSARAVQGLPRVKLEFSSDTVDGEVRAALDEAADLALIRLDRPLTDTLPLSLTRLRPASHAKCQVCYQAGRSLKLVEHALGEVGPRASFDIARGNAAILPGSPVLVGDAVVGQVRDHAGDSGRLVATWADVVLALLPAEVREPLEHEDRLAFRTQMQDAVGKLLETDGIVREALATELKQPKDIPGGELAQQLFHAGSVKMFAACNRVFAKLRGEQPDAAKRVRTVSLSALPALYELGQVRGLHESESVLITLEGEDNPLETELIMARHQKRRSRWEETSRPLPRMEAVENIEPGHDGAINVDHWLAAMRKQLRETMRVRTQQQPGRAEQAAEVDSWINEQLEWLANGTTNNDDYYRCYYVYGDASLDAFAAKLAETYPALQVVRLVRSRHAGADQRIYSNISNGLAQMLGVKL